MFESPWHWLVVLIIVLLLFGPKKLPDFARSLGEGIREFKKALSAGLSDEKPEASSVPKIEPPHEKPV